MMIVMMGATMVNSTVMSFNTMAMSINNTVMSINNTVMLINNMVVSDHDNSGANRAIAAMPLSGAFQPVLSQQWSK